MQTLSFRAAYTPLPLLIASLLALGVGRAEEGVLRNGERVPGELSSDGEGRLLFRRLGQAAPVPLNDMDQIRFPSQRLPPLRVGAGFRVVLRGDQHLTGELLGIDSDKVRLRTAWGDNLSIPRAAVVAVRHVPGFVTLFVDDFENDLNSWRLTGKPVLTTKQHTSGQRCLYLNSPTQAAEYTLSTSLVAGRAGINVYDSVQAQELAWQMEAQFAGSTGWPTVRVRLDPRTDRYTAEVVGTAATTGRLPRKDGWQRLAMEFSSDRLVLSLDDDILVSCRQPRSGGALRNVRLCCTQHASSPRGNAEALFDDFSLALAVPELPHPKGDPEQDEIWLLSGDQLFGHVLDGTAATIQLRGSFGSRVLRWSEVRAIYFRQAGTSVPKPAGKRVRVWLRPGIGLEPDVVEGTVRRLDAHHLGLRHAVLGDLEIDRKRLHRLFWPSERRID